MRDYTRIICLAIAIQLLIVGTAIASPTAEELKDWLQTPAALFALMYIASFASVLQQIKVAKDNGSDTGVVSYLGHWQETVGVVLANALAFAVLVLTDQLNFASALGIGYGANTVVDLLKKDGRSSTL